MSCPNENLLAFLFIESFKIYPFLKKPANLPIQEIILNIKFVKQILDFGIKTKQVFIKGNKHEAKQLII